MSYRAFSKTWTEARKAHRCIWCEQKIVPLEIYLREHSIYDGNHQNFAWHWDCYFDAAENYFKYGEEEFSPGNERPQMLPFRCMEAA
jgi:hypothetical protein